MDLVKKAFSDVTPALNFFKRKTEEKLQELKAKYMPNEKDNKETA
jgi:hypothetical protein